MSKSSIVPYPDYRCWWLYSVFVFETDLGLPEPFVSLARLLLLPESEWEKAKDKGKPPKPKTDGLVLSLILHVVRRRLEEYPTTLEVRNASPTTSSSFAEFFYCSLTQRYYLKSYRWTRDMQLSSVLGRNRYYAGQLRNWTPCNKEIRTMEKRGKLRRK